LIFRDSLHWCRIGWLCSSNSSSFKLHASFSFGKGSLQASSMRSNASRSFTATSGLSNRLPQVKTILGLDNLSLSRHETPDEVAHALTSLSDLPILRAEPDNRNPYLINIEGVEEHMIASRIRDYSS